MTNLLKLSLFNLQEASVSLVGSGVFGMMKVKLSLFILIVSRNIIYNDFGVSR